MIGIDCDLSPWIQTEDRLRLARRTRNLAQQRDFLFGGHVHGWMLLQLLRQSPSFSAQAFSRKYDYRWVQCTLAMATGMTNHRWSVEELFNFKIPPSRWKLPNRWEKLSKAMLQLKNQWY